MVQNSSNEVKRRVRLVARLPTGIGFIGASDSGAYVEDGACVCWDIGDLKPGDKKTVRLDTQALTAGTQTITAIVSAEGRQSHSHSIAIQVQGQSLDPPDDGRQR